MTSGELVSHWLASALSNERGFSVLNRPQVAQHVALTKRLLQKGELYHYWEEDIHAASVLTPRELFDQLSLEGRHRHVAATSTSM